MVDDSLKVIEKHLSGTKPSDMIVKSATKRYYQRINELLYEKIDPEDTQPAEKEEIKPTNRKERETTQSKYKDNSKYGGFDIEDDRFLGEIVEGEERIPSF